MEATMFRSTPLALCLLLAGVSLAQAQVQREHDAIINRAVTPKIMDATVGMIRIFGYRCDSVSAMRPAFTVNCWVVVRNNYRYEYVVYDRIWTARLKE